MSDTRDPETAQQLPTQNGYPVIQKLIITEAMESSLEIGVKKYGTGLQPFNGRDPLLDLEQELRDALVYARQLRYERDNPPITDGLRELRDALVVLVKSESDIDYSQNKVGLLDAVEQWMEGGTSIAKAVSTIRREAFERGSSPAVGALLAEIQNTGPGLYRDGMNRAVDMLIEAWADRYKGAYEAGVRDGRKQTQG